MIHIQQKVVADDFILLFTLLGKIRKCSTAYLIDINLRLSDSGMADVEGQVLLSEHVYHAACLGLTLHG